MQILLLDNHDSFTWNLVELLRRIGKSTIKIVKPEELSFSELQRFSHIIFSPGPGLPEEQPTMFGILGYVENLYRTHQTPIKIFGVCLGMQAIVEYYGGTLFRQKNVIHGQPRRLNILEPSHPIFREIGQGSVVGLYHSWAADESAFPSSMKILARSEDGVIMVAEHRILPFTGVQFHPESVITEHGAKWIENWLGS